MARLGLAWRGGAWLGKARALRRNDERMTTMANGRLYLGGNTTDPELRALLAAWTDWGYGQIIPYSEVEPLAGATRGTGRFRGVTNRWRAHLYKLKNWEIECIPDVGFRRRTEEERDNGGADDFLRGARRQRRGLGRIRNVEATKLTSAALATHDHRVRVMTAHVEATRDAVKQIAPPPPPKALPSSAVKEEASKEIEPPMPKGLRAVKEG